MASLRTSATQTALGETRKAPYICPKCEIRQMRLSPFNHIPRRQVRHSSTDTPAPPLLAKLKGDLKTAMRAKDTPRLNVLRAMISEYNNASKTNTPISTDMQLLTALKKKKAASQAAAAEAKAANRSDLEEKQMQEIKVIEEYAGDVKVMSDEQIREALEKMLESLKNARTETDLKVGNVLKQLFAPGGTFAGKPVDKAQVANIVKDMLDGK